MYFLTPPLIITYIFSHELPVSHSMYAGSDSHACIIYVVLEM